MQLSKRSDLPLQAALVQFAEPELPTFEPAEAVDRFTSNAQGVGLPIDEVTYGLDGSNDQPYRRYRISMSAKTGYPEVRRFVAALAADMPNVSLDSIRCTRESAAVAELGCKLVFSAFYRRETRG